MIVQKNDHQNYAAVMMKTVPSVRIVLRFKFITQALPGICEHSRRSQLKKVCNPFALLHGGNIGVPKQWHFSLFQLGKRVVFQLGAY